MTFLIDRTLTPGTVWPLFVIWSVVCCFSQLNSFCHICVDVNPLLDFPDEQSLPVKPVWVAAAVIRLAIKMYVVWDLFHCSHLFCFSRLSGSFAIVVARQRKRLKVNCSQCSALFPGFLQAHGTGGKHRSLSRAIPRSGRIGALVKEVAYSS